MRQYLIHNTLLKSIISICGLVAVLLLSGCSDNAVQSNSERMNSGAAEVEIKVGKIGVLAKQSMVEMNKLIMEIVSTNTSVTVLCDTSVLSGYAETTIKKKFEGLNAPDIFILQVKTVDKTGKIIHAGSKIFSTIPAEVVDVSITLSAQYSMLKASYNNLPDSVKEVSLEIALVDTLDSTFAKGTHDTVVLAYDYLPADTDGVVHSVSLRASGSFYGKDTVLYATDTTISAVSGVDKSYVITMKWVGPGYPDGAAAITVTIGAIGTTVINTGFTQAGGLSDLVDDLEDGNDVTRLNGSWYAYCDSVFGGKTTITPPQTLWGEGTLFTPAIGGANNSAYSASLTFNLSKGNYANKPYAGMGFDIDPDTSIGLNISTSTGISFYAKGNKFNVQIHTKNVTDYGWWQCEVPASTDWRLVTITWSQFSQPSWAIPEPFDRTKVRAITFEVIGITGDAGTFWVDDIHLPGYLR